MTVCRAVDIVIMQLLPEDGEALINVLMSVAAGRNESSISWK
jgi:hypothetical protein